MIELKPFDKTDFNQLISWVTSKELLIQFAGPIFTFPLTLEQLEIYVADKNRFPFKVINSKSGVVIGHAEVYYSGNKIAKLCRILIGDKSLRGQGIGEEIVNQLVEYSFNKLGALKVELNVYDWNTSAIKCYKKVGFVINSERNKTTHVENNKWTAINMTLEKFNWKK